MPRKGSPTPIIISQLLLQREAPRVITKDSMRLILRETGRDGVLFCLQGVIEVSRQAVRAATSIHSELRRRHSELIHKKLPRRLHKGNSIARLLLPPPLSIRIRGCVLPASQRPNSTNLIKKMVSIGALKEITEPTGAGFLHTESTSTCCAGAGLPASENSAPSSKKSRTAESVRKNGDLIQCLVECRDQEQMPRCPGGAFSCTTEWFFLIACFNLLGMFLTTSVIRLTALPVPR